MVDVEFYNKVMLPSWEVALKWMDPAMPNGAAFRAEVIGAEMRLPKNYWRSQGALSLAENNARMHPHYLPYDMPADGEPAPVINEMSESLAFATWVRFWRNVKFLIDKKLVDPANARELFREWYMWWAPFMTEFLGVCEEIKIRLRDTYGYDSKYWELSSIQKLQDLQTLDFDISPFCGHANEVAFKQRINDLTSEIIERFFDSVDEYKNEHIDGAFDPAIVTTPRPQKRGPGKGAAQRAP